MADQKNDTRAEVKPAESAPASKPEFPTKLIVSQAEYGFFDEHNRYRVWHEGDVITDPAEIAILVERGAPVRVVG